MTITAERETTGKVVNFFNNTINTIGEFNKKTNNFLDNIDNPEKRKEQKKIDEIKRKALISHNDKCAFGSNFPDALTELPVWCSDNSGVNTLKLKGLNQKIISIIDELKSLTETEDDKKRTEELAKQLFKIDFNRDVEILRVSENLSLKEATKFTRILKKIDHSNGKKFVSQEDLPGLMKSAIAKSNRNKLIFGGFISLGAILAYGISDVIELISDLAVDDANNNQAAELLSQDNESWFDSIVNYPSNWVTNQLNQGTVDAAISTNDTITSDLVQNSLTGFCLATAATQFTGAAAYNKASKVVIDLEAAKPKSLK